MNTPADIVPKPKSNRGVLSVRIFTWLAVALFFIADLLLPRGITVFWSTYCLFFGPVIIVGLAAIISFLFCILMRRKISFAYLLISLAVMGGVWYVTWYELRLR